MAKREITELPMVTHIAYLFSLRIIVYTKAVIPLLLARSYDVICDCLRVSTLKGD
jgi:hypothetical protein